MRDEMTVGELVELLEGLDPDAVVRLAIQPNYPLESTIAGVTDVMVAGERCDPDDGEGRRFNQPPNGGHAPEKVVYIAEGPQTGYGFRDVWDLASR